MKSLLTSLFVLVASYAWSQTTLTGKNYSPSAIEVNGARQSIAKDSIPFVLQFIDNQNMVYKEMKSNYYVLHHCTYTLKNNLLQISFLNNNKAVLNYQVQSLTPESMVLKENTRTITFNKTTD
jgi:hypothetical protein